MQSTGGRDPRRGQPPRGSTGGCQEACSISGSHELRSLGSALRETGHPAPCSKVASRWEDWESPTLGTGDTGRMAAHWWDWKWLALEGGRMGNTWCRNLGQGKLGSTGAQTWGSYKLSTAGMENWEKGQKWAQRVLGRARKWGWPVLKELGKASAGETGDGGLSSGAPGLYVCGASGLWGPLGNGVLGDLGVCVWVPQAQSLGCSRVLCSPAFRKCQNPPSTLGSAAEMPPALSCGAAMSWGCPMLGLPGSNPLPQPLSGCALPLPSPPKLKTSLCWGNCTRKGGGWGVCRGGHPGLLAPEPPSQGPFSQGCFASLSQGKALTDASGLSPPRFRITPPASSSQLLLPVHSPAGI